MRNDRTVEAREVAALGAAGLALTYAGTLALMFRWHAWILGADGRPLITDFLVFRISGALALHGNAIGAYDPHILHAAEAAAAGREFGRALPWDYPPLFFFVAAAAAALPYLPAFLGWMAATIAGYGAAIAAAARSRQALLVGCAAPAIFINAISGQNGCLTAALVGGFLVSLEERPLISGVFLGLLVYKPQLGVLFPLVLAAGRQWRVLASASVTALFGIALSALAFGAECFPAFLHGVTRASHLALTNGDNGWNNLESAYGLVRWLGFGNAAAWSAQIGVALCAIMGTIWLWRQPLLPFALKASALSAASLVVSPYLHIYDFAVLAVPLAFLYRHRPFDGVEIAGVVLANVCVGAFLFFPTPIGLGAIAIVVALTLRRSWQADSSLFPVASFHVSPGVQAHRP